MFLLDQFMETVNRPLFNAVTGERASQHRKEGGTTQRYRPPLPRFDSVLVVDDEDNYLLELWDFIEDIFNVTVVGTGSGRDALALISGSVTFDLVMIDITLKGESGIEVARRMLAVCPNLEIIFISHNPIREKDIPFLFGRRFQFAAKQSEEIVSAIEKVVDGYWELITSEQRVLSTDRGGFIGQLGIIAESAEPSSNKLTQMLAALKKKVAVTHALLLEVDTYCQPVSILVKKGKPLLKAVE